MVLSVFLVVLALLMLGVHEIGRRVLEENLRFGGGDIAFLRPTLGRFMVESVLALLLMLVLVTTPGFAAGQIAGERERRTLPLLQATLLRPSEIVLGKLWAATAWAGILVIAALPLVAISTVFGGVEVLDVVLGLVAILIIGLCLAAVSLGVSSLVQRTTAAVVISYAIVLVLVLGTGFLALLVALVGQRPEAATVPMYGNPFTALAGAVNAGVQGGAFSLPTPLTPFAFVLRFDDAVAAAPEVDRTWGWLWSPAFLVAIAVAGLGIASRRLRTTRPAGWLRRRRRPRTPEVIGG